MKNLKNGFTLIEVVLIIFMALTTMMTIYFISKNSKDEDKLNMEVKFLQKNIINLDKLTNVKNNYTEVTLNALNKISKDSSLNLKNITIPNPQQLFFNYNLNIGNCIAFVDKMTKLDLISAKVNNLVIKNKASLNFIESACNKSLITTDVSIIKSKEFLVIAS